MAAAPAAPTAAAGAPASAAPAAAAGGGSPRAKRQRTECRRAPDGRWYTESEFVAHYGGTAEWDAAAQSASGGGADADCGGLDVDAAVAAITQKSNDNLLKVNTHNTWLTEQQMRKDITKKRNQAAAAVAAGEAGAVGPPPAVEGEPSRLDAVLPGLVRIGKNPKGEIAYFSFASPEARDAAREFLSTLKGKRGKNWELVEVGGADLSYFDRRSSDKVRRAHHAEGSAAKTISEQCEPLRQLPYAEQLKRKEGNLRKTLCEVARNAAAEYRKEQSHPKWLDALDGKQACPLRCTPGLQAEWPDGIVGSPEREGYRNKCEFTIGRGKEGDEDRVGMLLGSFAEARGWVEPVTELAIVPEAAKRIAARLETLVRDRPEGLRAYEKETQTGFWRLLLVRTGRRPDDGGPGAMVAVQAHPGAAGPAAKAAVRERLRELFLPWHESRASESGDPHVASLQLIWHGGRSNFCPEDSEREVLLGGADIEESLSGLRFRVSPFSFFQINTAGMEQVLRLTKDFLELSPDKVLLDLCCGTGAIGLCLARHVRQVLGIDMVEAAIEDARRNAERNGIANASFHCGRVENLIDSVLGEYRGRSDFVAVVDPARGGLHQKVLRFLRECSGLKRFVYVSCEQSSLVRDCGILLKPRSKAVSGLPFRMACAAGVDLFPHTNRQEMVALFERIGPEDFTEGSPPAGGQKRKHESAGPTGAAEAAAEAADAADEASGSPCGGSESARSP